MSVRWKPISTAPRDGSWIVVNGVTIRTGQCFIHTAQWVDDANNFISHDGWIMRGIKAWDNLPFPPGSEIAP